MKALKAVILFVVVLGVIAVGAVSLWLGHGVKLAVERYGPDIVGAPVTVKGKRAEGLGSLGRQEGIACFAVALVEGPA